ncbi:unnamed protein product [Rodentolepis nana]|uniref:Ras-associating domain-containing protein n=1 Tax=Rodentolepis nana TaxID=102285 RepID=A0A0R3TEL6_RODNA|nr:unnamed protein product [Rodentolepis nana]
MLTASRINRVTLTPSVRNELSHDSTAHSLLSPHLHPRRGGDWKVAVQLFLSQRRWQTSQWAKLRSLARPKLRYLPQNLHQESRSGVSESCDMLDKQTQLWVDAQVGQNAVSFPLKYPIPSCDRFIGRSSDEHGTQKGHYFRQVPIWHLHHNPLSDHLALTLLLISFTIRFHSLHLSFLQLSCLSDYPTHLSTSTLDTPFDRSVKPLHSLDMTRLDVIVEAWEHDSVTSSDRMAIFRGQLIVAETPNTASIFEMKRDDVGYVNNFRLPGGAIVYYKPSSN